MISCGDDRQELFLVENEVDFIIPVGLNTIETHVFVIQDVPTLYNENLSIFGVSESDVMSISSGRGLLTGSFGEIDYDFIDQLSVRIRSNTSPEFDREMFYREQIPFSHNGDLQLLSSISELKEIISENTMDVEVRIRLRNFIPANLQAKLIFSYAVFDTN